LQRGSANLRGEDDILTEVAPSRIADREFRDWFARAGRLGASPSTAPRIWESVMRAHPRNALLEQVVAPTLILHRRDNLFATDNVLNDARARVPHAAVVELEGRDHFPFVGDVDALVAEIAAFVVGERRLPPPQRLLSAVLFTDLVGSTTRAAELGDENWKSVLDRHDARVRTIVGRCGGSVIKTTGDGVLALLPSAGVCLRAAAEVRRDLGAVGLDVRIGVHVGDIDRRGDDVSGLAVNIASRAMSKGDAGDIVVTVSVVAAVAGQAVAFEPLGTHELKGVPGEWQLFRVTPDP
jgi:class 3 adenylate cyclase